MDGVVEIGVVGEVAVGLAGVDDDVGEGVDDGVDSMPVERTELVCTDGDEEVTAVPPMRDVVGVELVGFAGACPEQPATATIVAATTTTSLSDTYRLLSTWLSFVLLAS